MFAQVLHYAVLVEREAWHPRGRLYWNPEVSSWLPAEYGIQHSDGKLCSASAVTCLLTVFNM